MLKAWRIIRKLLLWMFILQLLYIVICRWVNPPITLTQIGSVIRGEGLKRDYIDDSPGPTASQCHQKAALVPCPRRTI
ncbi:MAG TPA: hypothetical protein PKK69_02595, partial [Ferruginibacter sp.]|nr:hypothetical protein [Ferruginibacter sp.]